MSRLFTAVASAILTLGILPASATPFLTDTSFADGDWSAVEYFDNTIGGAAFTAAQVGSGGNPGPYRKVVHTYTGPGGFIVGHINETAAYDPSSMGALASVDVAFDSAFLNFPGVGGSPPFAVGIGSLIRQGSAYYTRSFTAVVSSAWTPFSAIGSTASNYSLSGGIGPANPDFSTSGAAIYFGFYTSNGSCCGGQNTTITGVDNFSVSVTQASAPAPSALSIILLGITGLLVRRRA